MKTKLLAVLAIAAVTTLFAQGPLAPPGAPAPTMKTLTQVDPRTDLQATPTPPGVDASNANYHFIINQPGSYYLSANLGVTKTNGIQINVEGVTLDLNGFQISRTSGTGRAVAHAGPMRRDSPLTPPGAPAPTMKTLDQLDAKLEKRTPISAPFPS